MVTVAPEMTACFSSLISPESDPEVCAKAGQQRHATSAVKSIRILVALIISISLLKRLAAMSLLDWTGLNLTTRRTWIKSCTDVQNFADELGRCDGGNDYSNR